MADALSFIPTNVLHKLYEKRKNAALEAEAQEAIINDVGNLCDMVEAMCNAQQDGVVKSFMDLPIWASPWELMASLCDD